MTVAPERFPASSGRLPPPAVGIAPLSLARLCRRLTRSNQIALSRIALRPDRESPPLSSDEKPDHLRSRWHARREQIRSRWRDGDASGPVTRNRRRRHHLRRRLGTIRKTGARLSAARRTTKKAVPLADMRYQIYRFDGAWKKLYSEDFTAAEKRTIIGALDQAVRKAGFEAEKHWGEPIEDRDSQVTFSALGQAAPLAEKEKWDPDFSKRKAIEAILAPLNSCVLNPFGRLYLDRHHQAGDRQGLWGQEAPRDARHRHCRYDLCWRRDLSWRK